MDFLTFRVSKLAKAVLSEYEFKYFLIVLRNRESSDPRMKQEANEELSGLISYIESKLSELKVEV